MIRCKKVYSHDGQDASYLSKLPLPQLREIPDITICEGMVTEAEWTLNTKKPTVEFVCANCGRRFYYETRKYLRVLDALNVDYSGRLP
jgi:predicted RNA-binding Zn-ribbon protein involved in translation (DUF1610 family)